MCHACLAVSEALSAWHSRGMQRIGSVSYAPIGVLPGHKHHGPTFFHRPTIILRHFEIELRIGATFAVST